MRFQLFTKTDCVGFERTKLEAIRQAMVQADRLNEPVRVFDRYAHYGDVDLWELRQGECFTRPLRIKSRAAA